MHTEAEENPNLPADNKAPKIYNKPSNDNQDKMYAVRSTYCQLTIIICILAPVALCLLITSLRKIISVNFMVRSSSLLLGKIHWHSDFYDLNCSTGMVITFKILHRIQEDLS